MPRTQPDPQQATYAPGFTARGMRRPTSTWTEYTPPAPRTALPVEAFTRRMVEDCRELLVRLYGAA